MRNDKRSDKKICPKCGAAIRSRSYMQHLRPCGRTPLAEELCDLLDAEPALSARGLAHRFGTTPPFIYQRLAGSRWDRARLLARAQRCQSLKQVKTPRVANGPQCARCGILLSACREPSILTQFGDLCFHCLFELGEIAERLIVHSTRRDLPRYRLNLADRQLLRRWRPAQLRSTL